MSTVRPTYRVDEDDPRAPSQEVWDSLPEAERQRVLAELPSEFPDQQNAPPEGDLHFEAKVDAKEILGAFFRRTGRRVYLACEMAVYYPNERYFAPDVMAVLDVAQHRREKWVVSAEGKGLDLALEIHVSGRRLKDLDRNVKWFARLGIHEYFVFDRRKLRLFGYRLPDPTARAYQPVLLQAGRLHSAALGLDLVIEGDRLRFLVGGAASLPDARETIQKLEDMVDGLESRREEEARRAAEEAQRANEEARRALEEAQRAEAARAEAEVARAEAARMAARNRELERQLAELKAELERTRRAGDGA